MKSQGVTQSNENVHNKTPDQTKDYCLKNWNNTENGIKNDIKIK